MWRRESIQLRVFDTSTLMLILIHGRTAARANVISMSAGLFLVTMLFYISISYTVRLQHYAKHHQPQVVSNTDVMYNRRSHHTHSHSAKTHHLALRSASTNPRQVPRSPILITVSQLVVNPSSSAPLAREVCSCFRVNRMIFWLGV